MSVRRLAEDSVQPVGFAFSGDNLAWADRTILKYPEGRQQSAVILLLMRAQEQDGWVTRAAIEHVADMLKMPLIRVLEVATFYTQFQLKPVGKRAHIQVCGTTPCMLRGSDDLKRVCAERIHPEQFHLNPSGTLSWEEVECLGACVNAPMVMIFKDTFEDLTPERLHEIVDAFERGEGASVKVGPQIDRHLSAPFGGLTSLNTEDGAAGAEGQATSGPTEDAAAPQGSGAGAATSDMSNAGRPRTHAAETDPTLKGPGAGDSKADQAMETARSIDPSAGAGDEGAGQTGGTSGGPTGVGGKENAAENKTSAAADVDGARRDGPLGREGAAAEDAVVQDFKRVDAPEGSARAAAGDAAPAASPEGEREAPPAEGLRTTDDVLPGPAAVDDSSGGTAAADQSRQPPRGRDRPSKSRKLPSSGSEPE